MALSLIFPSTFELCHIWHNWTELSIPANFGSFVPTEHFRENIGKSPYFTEYVYVYSSP